ncbi:MAG: hypothetical protein ABIB93_02360 [Chloroflexota bacterium]
MLLIDGVRYQEWTPTNEDELEQMVVEHAQGIFGENSIYFDKKQKLKSLAGVGSIPDGLVIVLGNTPQWHIVEVELSTHPLYEHIVPQVSKFINGIKNPSTLNGLVKAIYDAVSEDDFLMATLKKAIGSGEIYKFLTELIRNLPVVTIIIEKRTRELDEALGAINHPQKKVVEFKSFRREGAEAVHAHIFEPLYILSPLPRDTNSNGIKQPIIEPSIKPVRGDKRITIKDLLDSSIMKAGQVIYCIYKGTRYEGEILISGEIKIRHTGETYNSPSDAASSITQTSINGWVWWLTIGADGKEIKLDELRTKYRLGHSQ